MRREFTVKIYKTKPRHMRSKSNTQKFQERTGNSSSETSKLWGTIVNKFNLIASLVCFLFCGFVLVTLVMTIYRNKKFDPTKSSQFHKACVTCSMLLEDAYKPNYKETLLDSLPRSPHNKSLCCATNSDEMSALFKLLLRSQEVPKVLVSDSEETRPSYTYVSAHKRIYTTKGYEALTDKHFNEKDLFTLELNPNRTLPVLEHASGVKIKQYGYLIQYTGAYYVYSSIYFSPQSNKQCKDFKHKTWEHKVYRVNDVHRDRNKDLISGSHTCCDSCHVEQESIYTGGIFELHAGDMIGLKVTAYGLVNFSKLASFMGLTLLGTISNPE